MRERRLVARSFYFGDRLAGIGNAVSETALAIPRRAVGRKQGRSYRLDVTACRPFDRGQPARVGAKCLCVSPLTLEHAPFLAQDLGLSNRARVEVLARRRVGLARL